MLVPEIIGLAIASVCGVLLGVMVYRDWKDEILGLLRRGRRQQLGEHESLPEETGEQGGFASGGVIARRVDGSFRWVRNEPNFPCPSCGGRLIPVDHEVVDWECPQCRANSEEPYPEEERPVPEFIKDPEVAVRRANELADVVGLTRAQRHGVEAKVRRIVQDSVVGINDDGLFDVLGVSTRGMVRFAEDTIVLVTERRPVQGDASWADVMIRYVRSAAPEVYVAGAEGTWERDENDTRRIGVCLENAVVVMNVVQHRGIGELMRELDPHLTVDHWNEIPSNVRDKVEALPVNVRVELIRTLKLGNLYELRDREPGERDLQL